MERVGSKTRQMSSEPLRFMVSSDPEWSGSETNVPRHQPLSNSMASVECD